MDITIKQLNHIYQVRTPFERIALEDINLNIHSGEFIAIIGHTGSGKSTLIQHFNGLLKPTSGSIEIGDFTITANKKPKELYALRKVVGMVFQYPEHQLFEETIEKDICYGPMNFGMSKEQAEQKVREILPYVGLQEELLQKSPFDLSGGQMRRVAIAGVLAMDPKVIVLDEPTAGLDPKGQAEIMDMFYSLHKERKLTTILVTHSMEDAAKYADRIFVMYKGHVHLQGSPKEVFARPDQIKEAGIEVPHTVQFMAKFNEKFGLSRKDIPLTTEELANIIAQVMNEGGVR